MRTVEERNSILHRASELYRDFAFRDLEQLLSDLPQTELLQEPELAYWLANTFFRTKQYSRAWSLVRLLDEPCRRRGRDRLYRRRLNLEGGLLLERSDYEAAKNAFLETLSLAIRADDQWLVADATLNLGTVAFVHGHWEDALAAYQRARTAYTLLGKPYSLALSHQAIAMALRELGLLSDADSHFEQALTLHSASGTNRDIECAAVNSERALLYHAKGDYKGAEAMVQFALTLVLPIGAMRPIAETLRVLGLVQISLCLYNEARATLELALNGAKMEEIKLLEGEIYATLAELARSQGNKLDASFWTVAAAAHYRKIGLDGIAERVIAQAT